MVSLPKFSSRDLKTSLAISSVAAVQTSIILLCLSPRVIIPLRNWSSILSISLRATSTRFFFSGGIIISKIPMEIPALVAISKPISLSRSRDSIVSSLPLRLYVSKIRLPRSPLRAGSLKNPSSSGQIVLKSARPTVVVITLRLEIPNNVSFPLSGFLRRIQLWRLRTPSCKALNASSSDPIRGSFSSSEGTSPLGFMVRKYEPKTISWEGVSIGFPLDGEKMLWVAIINNLASIIASTESGTWTAIWSPSKSALYGVQTSGWTRIALPSIRTGSKAWIDKRCKVGARFNSTGCPLVTSSKISQTSGERLSIIFRAPLTVWTNPNSFSLLMINGSNKIRAIFLGIPHWWSLSSGPITMTERPE